VGLHGLDRAGTRPGDDVLVLGFGPIGAAASLCARALGARATVVELHPGRRAKAEGLGFATVEAGDDLPRRARRALGSGGADVVVESTGAPQVAGDAIECAARGGRIVLLGMPGSSSEIDLRRIVLFERSLVGSLGYRNDLPRVVRMVSEGQLDPTPVVDQIVALDAAADTLADLAAGPSDAIKVLVRPRG
jgi:(R,R)-butanediol dehydrogenase/meso-butanediol dehydrogenase/diacetyl reductase